MADGSDLEQQELLADTLQRADRGLAPRERTIELLLGLVFLAVVAVLWGARPPGDFAPVPAGLGLLALALATRVRFETPFGFTVATQLAFVPLLFAMPVVLVPIAVVLGMSLARLPELFAGRYPPSRLIKELVNSWYAIGPVAVFALTATRPDHAAGGLLVIALLAQFGVDFAVSTFRYWLERGVGLVGQLRETWVYGVDAALSGIALVVGEAIHHNALAALTPIPLLVVLSIFARERNQRMRSLVELSNAYHGTARVLGDVVEADDGYTGAHSRGVVRLATAVAEELELDAAQRRNVEFGALLHDVGKITVPKEIINKPAPLDPQEWAVVTTHTIAGQEMLDRIGGFMHEVGLIVRSHHEHWDGNGYPDGLAGEAIPLESRIIACCDAWNAMRTDRSYRKALSYEVARTELEANAGRQFDPRIAAVVLRLAAATDLQEPAPAVEPRSADAAPAGGAVG